MMAKARRDRGSGSLFQRASDGLWMGYVTLPPDPITGRSRRKMVSAKKKTDAAAKLTVIRRELEKHGDLPTANLKVAAWAETWLKRVQVKPKTLASYRSNVQRFILPSLGKVALSNVSAAHVRRMMDGITAAGLSPTTAAQAHRVLRKMLADAAAEDLVTVNVAQKVKPPRPAHVKRDMLTPEQAVAVLEAEPDLMWRTRWAIALFNGARQGEVLGIRPDVVDVSTGLVELAWQVQRLGWRHGCGGACGRKRGAECPQRTTDVGAHEEAEQVRGGLWVVRPKSSTSWRRIMLMPQDRLAVATLMRDRPGAFVFHEGGQAVDPRRDHARWKEALERAGVPPVALHSARNSAATLLAAAGVDEQTRMLMLGHSSVTMTRHYTRVDVDGLARAMAAVTAIAGRPEAPQLAP